MSLSNFFELSNFSGNIAFITCLIGLCPQVYKSYKTKSTDDISMGMLVNYLVCSIAWMIHGVCINSEHVLYSNVIGTVIAVVSIVQKIVYDKNSEKSVAL